MNTLKTHEDRLRCELIHKGAIKTNRPDKYKDIRVKLTLKDIVCGIEQNPRLLGPTIVMLVQHPATFKRIDKLPKDIQDTITNLKKGNETGPDCRYEEYHKLYALCAHSSDLRVKGVNKKIRKNFRLTKQTLKLLEDAVKRGQFRSETEAIEQAINLLLT